MAAKKSTGQVPAEKTAVKKSATSKKDLAKIKPPFEESLLTPEETPEDRIAMEIKKYNFVDAALDELKKKYKDIKVLPVPPIDADKATKEAFKKSLDDAKEAISVLRPMRTGTEKKRKELNEDYIAIKSGIDKEGKRIISLVAELEDPIQVQVKEAEAAIEKQKEDLKIAEQVKINQRAADLLENGMKFVGQWYEIGEITIDAFVLKSLTDEAFLDLLGKVKLANEKIIEEEAAAAAKKKQEEEELEKQKQEQEQAQKKLDKEAEDLKQQQANLRRQVIGFRKQSLEAIGFVFSTVSESFKIENPSGIISVILSDVESFNDFDWSTKFSAIQAEAFDLKSKETERLKKEEDDRRAENEKQIVYQKRFGSLQALGLGQSGENVIHPPTNQTICSLQSVKDSDDQSWIFIYDQAKTFTEDYTEKAEKEKQEKEKKRLLITERTATLIAFRFGVEGVNYFYIGAKSKQKIEFDLDSLTLPEQEWLTFLDSKIKERDAIDQEEKRLSDIEAESAEKERLSGLSNAAKIEEYLMKIRKPLEDQFPSLPDGSPFQKELLNFYDELTSQIGKLGRAILESKSL